LGKASIIKNINNSDEYKFTELFKVHYQRLCRIAYNILKEKEAAKEIVQEVFMKLWENRYNQTIKTYLEAYLYKSVFNTSINVYKSTIMHKNAINKDFQEEVSEENSINTDIFLRNLKKALDTLPEKCRMIYHLKNFEGLSQSEIATYLGIKEKTVENQLNIALKKLKEILFSHKSFFYE